MQRSLDRRTFLNSLGVTVGDGSSVNAVSDVHGGSAVEWLVRDVDWTDHHARRKTH